MTDNLVEDSYLALVEIPVPEGQPHVCVKKDGCTASSIIKCMYFALFVYSYLVSYLSNCPFYTIPIYYILVYVAFYLWHWQAHHLIWWIPFNRVCYQKHKEHHYVTYPKHNFFGKQEKETGEWIEYFNPLDWVTQHEGLLYTFMIIIIVMGYMIFETSTQTMLGAVVGYLITGIIGNYLHHCYHIRGHWLECYSWFHELRALHYVHHLGSAKQNYGILNMSLDKLVGSFTYNIQASSKTT